MRIQNLYAVFVPRIKKINALWEGRMFEITAHEFHLSVDQILHTIVYLNDVQNIYIHCLKNSEKRLLASSCVSPSVRTEQLGSHSTDFH
jgi:hypothetical protein